MVGEIEFMLWLLAMARRDKTRPIMPFPTIFIAKIIEEKKKYCCVQYLQKHTRARAQTATRRWKCMQCVYIFIAYIGLLQ